MLIDTNTKREFRGNRDMHSLYTLITSTHGVLHSPGWPGWWCHAPCLPWLNHLLYRWLYSPPNEQLHLSRLSQTRKRPSFEPAETKTFTLPAELPVWNRFVNVQFSLFKDIALYNSHECWPRYVGVASSRFAVPQVCHHQIWWWWTPFLMISGYFDLSSTQLKRGGCFPNSKP